MTGLLDTKRPLEFAVSRLFANTLLAVRCFSLFFLQQVSCLVFYFIIFALLIKNIFYDLQ
jgi:hypothetical protein